MGCDPQFGSYRLVKLLQGSSAYALHEEFTVLERRLPSLWIRSSLVSTLGAVKLETLKQYVESQKGR